MKLRLVIEPASHAADKWFVHIQYSLCDPPTPESWTDGEGNGRYFSNLHDALVWGESEYRKELKIPEGSISIDGRVAALEIKFELLSKQVDGLASALEVVAKR